MEAVESLSAETAIELFAARARWLRPGLEFVGSEAESAQEIVRLVDGMPLAIELAAARMRVMSAAQIVKQMRRRFSLLTGGGNPRHETLAVAIDGSWELLSAWEQSAWAQCAVFEGGFALEAAEGVMDLSAWPEAPWVVDVVQSLVDKSLLRTWVPAVGTSDGLPEARFGMYVSLQDYARMKLREEGVAAAGGTEVNAERAAEIRHGKWYARYGTDEVIEALDRHGGVRRRRQLERELENLVTACRRAVERGGEDLSVAAYRASWAVFELLGPFGGSVEIGRQVLADPRLGSDERAKTLRTLALAERLSGQMEEARAHFDAALAIHREMGNRGFEGVVLGNLAGLLQEQGRMNEARVHHEAALAIAHEVGDRGLEGNILSNLGGLDGTQGRMVEARADFEAALAIHREVGNRRFEGAVLGNLGSLHFDQGRMEEARACYEAALAIHREVGHRRGEGIVLNLLGGLFHAQGHMKEGRTHYEAALTIAREMGTRRLEGTVLGSLGYLLHASGLIEEAHVHFEAALAIHRKMGDRRMEGSTLRGLAQLLHEQGRIEEARDALTKGEEILRQLEDRIGLGRILCLRAKLEHGMGNIDAARIGLAQAEALANQVGSGPDSWLGRVIAELRQTLTSKR